MKSLAQHSELYEWKKILEFEGWQFVTIMPFYVKPGKHELCCIKCLAEIIVYLSKHPNPMLKKCCNM